MMSNSYKNKNQNISADFGGKLPPQAVDLEEAVLGAMLLQMDAAPKVVSILKPDVFYLDKHQVIYKAILELHNNSRPIDILTVTDKLRSNGDIDRAGGAFGVVQLTNNITSAANIEYHTLILLNYYGLRSIILTCYEALAKAYTDGADSINLSRDIAFALEKNSPIDMASIKPIGEIAQDVFKVVEKAMLAESDLIGLPSSLNSVNKVMMGYCEPDLIILGGRPGEGKTSFSLQEAYTLAKAGIPTAYFCFEMSALQLATKLVSAEIKAPVNKIRHAKKLTDEQFKSIKYWADDMDKVPLYIYDVSGCTISRLRSLIKDAVRKYGIKMGFVDYLQLVTEDEGFRGLREQEISSISRKLKQTCKELNIPIMVLAQLSREDKTQNVRLYKNSDFKESGAIEANADVCMFVMRPKVVHGVTEMKQVKNKVFSFTDAMIIIGKNRQGETGVIHCNYLADINTFTDPELNSISKMMEDHNPNEFIEPMRADNNYNTDDLPF
mgnify:CR=1 FL=1